MPSTQDAPFAHAWLTQSSMSRKSHTGTVKFLNFINARKLSLWANRCCLICAFPTRFTIQSSESRRAVARITIDAIYAWCTIGAIVVDTVIQVYGKILKEKSKCHDWCWKLTARCLVAFFWAVLTRFTMFSWESHWTVARVAIDAIYAWSAVGACVINAIVDI